MNDKKAAYNIVHLFPLLYEFLENWYMDFTT